MLAGIFDKGDNLITQGLWTGEEQAFVTLALRGKIPQPELLQAPARNGQGGGRVCLMGYRLIARS